MSPEICDLLLDLEDHHSYIQDAENEIESYKFAFGVSCPKLEENLEEAVRQVQAIRKQIRELS